MQVDAEALDIGKVRHSTLVDSSGKRYVDFRRSLTPRWSVVWATLLGGHLALALSAGLVAAVGSAVDAGWAASAGLAVAGGALIGFWLHYLMTYLHEGAHYNLAPDRETSDRLTNTFVGLFVGMNVKAYRKVHFEHHRYLGTTRDPERSYFAPLNLRFLVEGFTGVRLVRALKGYREVVRGKARPQDGEAGSGSVDGVFVVAALFNGAIVVCSLWAGAVVLALAWATGQLLFLPLLNTVRQVLEHRSEFADDLTDYSVVPHGPVNRLFGDGLFAAVFGAAGFNRHLLHHWDPSVSFTRLKDVERFLMDTDVAPLLQRRQTTYFRTWRQLDRI
ncbi:fatty acid desaturase family protein [Nonomuraea roseoviolacea]|uniref:fatty acid desaturase family protein n=1 Tax=Nonomuraea roseoviolacea TaxID=103837 RepID=UPI0020A2F8D1|nr:fatty acid desaturase [Nonomuraea roseoviolacea]